MLHGCLQLCQNESENKKFDHVTRRGYGLYINILIFSLNFIILSVKKNKNSVFNVTQYFLKCQKKKRSFSFLKSRPSLTPHRQRPWIWKWYVCPFPYSINYSSCNELLILVLLDLEGTCFEDMALLSQMELNEYIGQIYF